MLNDIPVVYMTDAGLQWEDFKKAVKGCALAWNFREWLNTTVYGGTIWRKLAAAGVQVKQEGEVKVKEGEVLEEVPDAILII